MRGFSPIRDERPRRSSRSSAWLQRRRDARQRAHRSAPRCCGPSGPPITPTPSARRLRCDDAGRNRVPLLQQSLCGALADAGLNTPVATVLTQVVVSPEIRDGALHQAHRPVLLGARSRAQASAIRLAHRRGCRPGFPARRAVARAAGDRRGGRHSPPHGERRPRRCRGRRWHSGDARGTRPARRRGRHRQGQVVGPAGIAPARGAFSSFRPKRNAPA